MFNIKLHVEIHSETNEKALSNISVFYKHMYIYNQIPLITPTLYEIYYV